MTTVLGRFLHSLNGYVRDHHSIHRDLEGYYEYNFAKVPAYSAETCSTVAHLWLADAPSCRSGAAVRRSPTGSCMHSSCPLSLRMACCP